MPYKDPEKARANNLINQRRYRKRKTDVKIAKFEAIIAERPSWPKLDLAWAAGMFEGEGTITITITVNRNYGRSIVTLSNTDPEVILFFQERWPGAITERPRQNNWSIAWNWRLQGNEIFPFLLDVTPHFRTKAERAKAQLLMASQRERWAGYRLSEHKRVMDEYVQKIRHLNLRGAARADPSGAAVEALRSHMPSR